jgi:hypothetical protein
MKFVITDGGHSGEGEEDGVVEAPPVAVSVGHVVLHVQRKIF